MECYINVFSEIGKLRRILLHRPGIELDQLHPDYLPQMLFEDTLYLPEAQKEHDAFANLLRENGVEVVYLRDLFREAISDHEVREMFLREFLDQSEITSIGLKKKLYKYLNAKQGEDFIEAVFKGVRKDELDVARKTSLPEFLVDDYPYFINPLSAIYYMRDNSISIGNGCIISNMTKTFRKRETLLLKYIHKYVPRFYQGNINYWFDNSLPYGIEGGDVAVFSDKAVGIGYSERTSCGAIEYVADKLLNGGFEKVIVFDMEKRRSMMHLDDILTMIDYNKIIANPILEKRINIYEVTKGGNKELKVSCFTDNLAKIFEKVLGINDIQVIKCGGGDPIVSVREMWTLGANVLTVEPGKVIAFGRNDITNELLDKNGVKLLITPDSELVKGRGGPRCMSMPLYRDNL